MKKALVNLGRIHSETDYYNQGCFIEVPDATNINACHDCYPILSHDYAMPFSKSQVGGQIFLAPDKSSGCSVR